MDAVNVVDADQARVGTEAETLSRTPVPHAGPAPQALWHRPKFGSTCLVARAEDGIRGYVFGFVTPDGTGTSIENTGSIAFHRSLGFDAKIVDDHNGPGRPLAVFRRGPPLAVDRTLRKHGNGG